MVCHPSLLKLFSPQRKVNYLFPLSTPPLRGITRCGTLKIIGVTVTNTLFMAEHIENVIKSSSQTLHALRILRLHGISATIHRVLQAVVIAKLTYASQSWSGFTSAADIQRLNAFLRRSFRQGFCPLDLTDITDIFDAADEAFFCKNPTPPKPPTSPLSPDDTPYNLRRRRHNRQLTPKINKLYDSNFIQRICNHLYWLTILYFYLCIVLYSILLLSCWAAFCPLVINEYCIVLYCIVLCWDLT